MYDNGLGVGKAPEKAFQWYRKAAEQGDNQAQYTVATRYMHGLGVQKDFKQAVL